MVIGTIDNNVCKFNIAGLNSFEANIEENLEAKNDKSPTHIIKFNNDINIGSLWKKQKDKREYYTGNIYIAFKSIDIYINLYSKEIVAFIDEVDKK